MSSEKIPHALDLPYLRVVVKQEVCEDQERLTELLCAIGGLDGVLVVLPVPRPKLTDLERAPPVVDSDGH